MKIKFIRDYPKGGLKQHDIVEWCGLRGIVATVNAPNPEVPIQVIFTAQKHVIGFRADGKFLDFHAEPSLIFIKRPKRRKEATNVK